METKENQWRLLHTIALHEMSARERLACAELDTLSTRLDHLIVSCDKMERLVKQSRAHRFREQLLHLTAKPVQDAASHLSLAQYMVMANNIVDDANAIPVRCDAHQMMHQLNRFHRAAERFKQTAAQAGVIQLTALADVLEKLAATVASEAAVVVDTANHVKRAAHVSEIARSKLLTDIVSLPPQ